MVILEVSDLTKYFLVKSSFYKTSGWARAVDGVRFHIEKGETFGLIGESGCGKTTLARCILRLVEPSSGSIMFDGQDVLKIRRNDLRKLRRRMQIIFQEPSSSVDQRMSVRDIVAEPLLAHDLLSKEEVDEEVLRLLEQVGLGEEHLSRYPYELSGGQNQRLNIARALGLRPEFLILDEPTSALDVSVQAQILNLLNDLKHRFNLTYLFISHDLHVVTYMSDRIAVMYLGKIVEQASAEELWKNPLHPYTMSLVSSVATVSPNQKREPVEARGEVPSPVSPPPGCRYHTRCPFGMVRCQVEEPSLVEISPNHWAACHLY